MSLDEIETQVNAALCDAIKDRGNAMLTSGHTIEEVAAWCRANAPVFAEIRAHAIATAMS